MSFLPKIALTMGDPAGIGPEIAVRAAVDPALAKFAAIVVYGCPDVIKAASAKFAGNKSVRIRKTGDMLVSQTTAGKIDAKCGSEARNAVVEAVCDILDGRMDALVTAPVNKASINLSGVCFTGHTELVAELCGTADFAMMQSAGDLRVAFVTTHIPLKKVSEAVTEERIIVVAKLLNSAVIEEGVKKPKLACAGLNPHAGENGYMGKEERKIIIPALEKLRVSGIQVDGPFPPDTLFIEKIRRGYDGIISMFHDQGHIPFKMLAFERGVNSTLGLPIIRTSVDHGTAFDIAWKGVADTGSLYAAIKLAALRAKNRKKIKR